MVHPLNLVLRAVLELLALVAIGEWGWEFGGWPMGLAGIATGTLIWGLFNVPGDPSRSGRAPVPVPGWLRLFLEILLFALAFYGWGQLGRISGSRLFGMAVVLHYLLSWRRVLWLLRMGRSDGSVSPE